MAKSIYFYGTTGLGLEAILAVGVFLAVMLCPELSYAGTGEERSSDNLLTAAERADNLGRDAELDLYSKVLRATQGRGTYRLLIKSAQKCETREGASG